MIVLVVAGTQDRATPPEGGRYLAEQIAGSKYVELDTGHVPFLEAPDAFLDAVRPFLDALSPTDLRSNHGARGHADPQIAAAASSRLAG